MSSITSTGKGTGLDIKGIVTASVAAEKDPAMSKLIKSSADATAQISAYGLLNSELSDFKSSYKDLAYSSSFSAASASSSDEEILDVDLGVGAATGQWEFEVLQRAQAHTLSSSAANAIASVDDPIGTGEITLRYGSYSKGDGSFTPDPDKPIETLTIDNANNSLTEMRDSINDGDYSVKASILNDGENYRLVLTHKETGEANSMEITVADDDGIDSDVAGLSRFTYSSTVKHLDETSAAQDAKIQMDGISISRESNKIGNVIEGVTLNLNGETQAGKKVTLGITKDISKVQDQIQGFVDKYNSTIDKMNELTQAGGDGDKGGILNGDSTVRNIQSQMRTVLNTRVNHIDGAVKSFADLGMLTERNGSLSLDSTKFARVLDNDMESVAKFFTASGGASDPLISFDGNNSLTKPGSYAVEVTQLATQGTLSGSNISLNFPLTIDADNDSFIMRVDGSLSGDINLTPKTYNAVEELAAEMQSQINADSNFASQGISVKIANDAGKLDITSNKYGTSSSVAFTQVDAGITKDIGFAEGGGTNGSDAEGLIDGVEAFSDGQHLLSQNGNSTGIKIQVEDGALGSRGKVSYSEGMTTVMNDLLAGIIDRNISASSGDVASSHGTIDGKVDSLYKKIGGNEEKQETLNYRMDKLEARLYKDYNAMDSAVSGIKNTQEYLAAALGSLPGNNRN